jgi:hypothetical protein
MKGSLAERESQSLQLFRPVEHHVESTGPGLLLDHDEPLAIGAHIVVSKRDVLKDVTLFEQLPRLRQRQVFAGRHVDDHHLVSNTIEDLLAVPAPQRVRPALCGDLPSSVRAGERANIHLHLTRFIGGSACLIASLAASLIRLSKMRRR